MFDHEQWGLLLYMGLGKTIITLAVLKALLVQEEIKAALIVAPLSVIKNVWRQEAMKWDYTQNLNFSLLWGPNKASRLKGKADIYLINYEGLIWLAKEIRTMLRKSEALPFDCIVFDESSFMKNVSTKRFRRWRSLFGLFKRRYILTGTFVDDKLQDVWGQMFILDLGERLGGTYTGFIDTYFYRPRPSRAPWLLVPKKGAAEKIGKKIADIATVLNEDDYLELPRVIENDIVVDLPNLELYENMERELYVKLREGKERFLFNANALTMATRQFTSGFVTIEEENTWLHSEKIEFVLSVEEPAIVVCEFRYTIQHLRKTLPNCAVIYGDTPQAERDSAIKRWNDGELAYLVVNPRITAHGLNLEKGGRVMIFYDIPWSWGIYRQSISRLRRGKQKAPVVVYRLIAKNTIDETIARGLDRKQDVSEELARSLEEKYGKINNSIGS